MGETALRASELGFGVIIFIFGLKRLVGIRKKAFWAVGFGVDLCGSLVFCGFLLVLFFLTGLTIFNCLFSIVYCFSGWARIWFLTG